MSRQPSRRGPGFVGAVLLSCVVGIATVGGTLALRGADNTVTSVQVPTEEYGRRLLTQTADLIGPDQPDPAMRYSGSRLACSSCHLNGGLQPGALSLLQAAEKYPRFSGRDGGISDLDARIDGCMTRSMNGRAMPHDSIEMASLALYIRSLGRRYDAIPAAARVAVEPAAFATPARAAGIEAGGMVFREHCALCHGVDGLGLAAAGTRKGYVFPPLWGPDSFNNGAGMHRVLTAARFIKAKMPLGKATLTDSQAFDVAAYINAQPRPQMAGLDRDYPDRATKPVDSAYGPYADGFPQEQHRVGPFGPIEAFYKTRAASK
jgi:thiosulfate dehydrogenase